MKKNLVYLILVLIILGMSINVVFASFIKGDKLEKIETNYSVGESLRGWINISLQDEPAISSLTAFSSNITILDFLDLNSADYSCIPASCISSYAGKLPGTSKIFNIGTGQEKIIGLKLTGGTVTDVSGFSININSDATKSLFPQLWIDILGDAGSLKEYDWRAYTSSGIFGAELNDYFSTGTQKAEIKKTQYCEEIEIPAASKFELGANIEAISGEGGSAQFEFRIYNEDYDSSCTASASAGGRISCNVSEFSLIEDQNFFVCILEKDSLDNNDYTISYEQNSPHGFTGEYDDEYTHDFDIFARAGEFAPVGSFVLNNNEIDNFNSEGTSDIEGDIETYLDDVYDMKCNGGCIVPVKFRSMAGQSITLSNASLTYTAGVTTTTKDLYDLEKTEATIDMNFTKLYLDDSGLKVPEISGTQSLDLKLSGVLIASKIISVSKGPTINYLAPTTLPAAIPVKFFISVSGSNITKYKWDFGDETDEEETTGNTTTHTYDSLGNYNVKVSVTGKGGESSKTFSVKVVSPKEAINTTITEKRQNLNKTLKDFNKITGWYKAELEKKAGLNELSIALKSLEKKYESASSSDDYVDIMTQLTELRVPYSLNSSSSQGVFFPNPEQVDPSYVAEIGSEKADNPEGYVNPILNWFSEHLDVQAESKVYSLYYDNEIVPLMSSVKLKIKPKEDFGREVYLIIDRPYEDVKFSPSQEQITKAAGSATGLIFQGLEKSKEEVVEFILPEKIIIIDLPAYLSPEFSQLPESIEIGVCDNDGKCEKSEGEDSKNCKNDCKPWGKVMIYIIILLFIAFIVYIILQEWYKRKYEKYLFPNRNDLFNLINFISNALNQGFNKDNIIKRLEKHSWKKEQIIYSFKKVRGERTGMWEIPIFRFFEQRKIKEEIAKRRQNLA